MKWKHGLFVEEGKRTDVDNVLRRLVLGSRNVFFAQLLWPSLVRLVLLEFGTFAQHALFLFNSEWPKPVERLPANIRVLHTLLTHTRREKKVAHAEQARGGGVWREKESNAHKVHDGHTPALREGLAPDALPVQWLVVVVIVIIVFQAVCAAAVGRTVLSASGTGAATSSAHERDELGDEIVNVEGARACFHRARFGRVHVGRRHEEGRVQRRFLWRRHWKRTGMESGAEGGRARSSKRLWTRRGKRTGGQVGTLIEERVGQLHFFEQLLGRVFTDVQLVTWHKNKQEIEGRRSVNPSHACCCSYPPHL